MKTELQDKEVLAMYDIRGIQDYVFKTNAAKEVVGASKIVDNIILNGLKKYVSKLPKEEQEHYVTDWTEENTEKNFVKAGSELKMQVMFVGGGNAYVLYRTGAICSSVNRYLGKYVLESTYSLNLAVAVVEKTDSYKDDYSAINIEMRKVKAHMPLALPVGSFPFMVSDTITGYPVSGKDEYSAGKSYLCTESLLKRKAATLERDPNIEKVFDNMVTEKGDNSTLALIHIDGNSLGKRIMNIMSPVTGYPSAIKKMRKLSAGIDNTFKETFKEMEAFMDEESKKLPKQGRKFRKIVLAGDDITFVCNAKLALPAVEFFLKKLNEKEVPFLKTEEEPNPKFSACAGIAYFNSHFPFSDAYKVAEACCESAKDRAKEPENSNIRNGNQIVGNFIDFQMCTNVNASDLDTYREKHYLTDGNLFITRPYYVSVISDNGLNEKNKKYDIEILKEKIGFLTDTGIVPRSLAKEIRNVIPQGENEILKEMSYIKSRNMDSRIDISEDTGAWYDACELMDLAL